jgi:hypothetical protein
MGGQYLRCGATASIGMFRGCRVQAMEAEAYLDCENVLDGCPPLPCVQEDVLQMVNSEPARKARSVNGRKRGETQTHGHACEGCMPGRKGWAPNPGGTPV